ncbi:MAG: metallophosphoesterase [Firmicutes bacterium]|nr:metallophosphoesterase [Bacillota bacterium]
MKKVMIILLVLVIIVCIYLYFETTTLEVSNYNIKSKKLPNSFEGYKIAHISDFHNTKYGKLKKQILKSLRNNKPDILVITGDFIDSRRTNMEISLDFIKNVKNIPIYYVAGNHESRIDEYLVFKEKLKNLGVIVLENEKIQLTKNTETINLIGLQDPSFDTGENNSEEMRKIINSWLLEYSTEDNFDILLLHRPELFEVYVENNVDLVFTGHAHGGQIVIPFIGPVIAPNQGFFPKLTSGVHKKNNTNLVISRGIGNSLCPIRVNNNPELIYVTLKKR